MAPEQRMKGNTAGAFPIMGGQCHEAESRRVAGS